MVHPDGSAWPNWQSIFFTANSFSHQLTTVKFIQHLALQTLAIVGAIIHSERSEYATAKKVTGMYSHDECQGKYCPSMVIACITAESTALSNYTRVGSFITPATIIFVCFNRRSSTPIGIPQPGLVLHYLILRSMPHLLSVLLHRMGAPQSPPQLGLEVPQIHSLLSTPPLQRYSGWMPAWLNRHSSIPIGAPLSGFVLLNFILCSSITICTPIAHPARPHQALLISWGHISFPPKFIILPFTLYFDSQLANISNPTISISQIKLNNIGIQFYPLTRPKWFANMRSTCSLFPQLMNCVILHLSAIKRLEIYWKTFTKFLMDIILSLSEVIFSVLLANVLESVAIFLPSVM